MKVCHLQWKSQNREIKTIGAVKDESTLSQRPRGRPRKKPIEDNAIKTQSKRPKGRPRKNPIEKSLDTLDCNDQYVQALAVQLPEDSSEAHAVDGVPRNAHEHSVQEECGKKQKCYKRAASVCDPSESPLQGRRLRQKKQAGSHSDNVSPNGSLGISSGSFLISKDVASPIVVLCLAHNGKVAWDVKWQPSNASKSKCKHQMGYLAVLLGSGSLEV